MSSSQGASVGGIAAAVGSGSSVGTSLSTTTMMVIGVVLLALVIGLILYLRSGGTDSKARRAEDIRKELELRRELEELEKQ